jgi:hypothetical protein
MGEAGRGSPAGLPAGPAGGSAAAGSSSTRVTSSRAIASRETCSSALARFSASSSILARRRSASARAAASRRLSSSISDPIRRLPPVAHDGRRPHHRSTGNQAKLQVRSPFRRAAPEWIAVVGLSGWSLTAWRRGQGAKVGASARASPLVVPSAVGPPVRERARPRRSRCSAPTVERSGLVETLGSAAPGFHLTVGGRACFILNLTSMAAADLDYSNTRRSCCHG